MAVGAAERTVADARMADLKAAQYAARRRHIAAKGLVSRARKDGSAEKIAAAAERERQAYAEFMAVSDASIEEMFAINRAGLDRLGAFLDQVSPAWEADAAVLREITGRARRSGNEYDALPGLIGCWRCAADPGRPARHPRGKSG